MYNEQMGYNENLIKAVEQLDIKEAARLIPFCDNAYLYKACLGLIDALLDATEEEEQEALLLLDELTHNHPNAPKLNVNVLEHAIKMEVWAIVPRIFDIGLKQGGPNMVAEWLESPGNPDRVGRGSIYLPACTLFTQLLRDGQADLVKEALSILKASTIRTTYLAPLHHVVDGNYDPDRTQDYIRCVDLMLDFGVDINYPDKRHMSPIHYVLTAKMAQHLISRGADVLFRDATGNMPLYNLWNNRNVLTQRKVEKNVALSEPIEIAKIMIQAGARWKDAPTVDIMMTQINDHPLSEFLITGRKRSELAAYSKVEIDLEEKPSEAPLGATSRKPRM